MPFVFPPQQGEKFVISNYNQKKLLQVLHEEENDEYSDGHDSYINDNDNNSNNKNITNKTNENNECISTGDKEIGVDSNENVATVEDTPMVWANSGSNMHIFVPDVS